MSHTLLRLVAISVLLTNVSGRERPKLRLRWRNVLVPEELPTVAQIFWSLVPQIVAGTNNTKLGLGFRVGPNADFQVLVELGPQFTTESTTTTTTEVSLPAVVPEATTVSGGGDATDVPGTTDSAGNTTVSGRTDIPDTTDIPGTTEMILESTTEAPAETTVGQTTAPNTVEIESNTIAHEAVSKGVTNKGNVAPPKKVARRKARRQHDERPRRRRTDTQRRWAYSIPRLLRTVMAWFQA